MSEKLENSKIELNSVPESAEDIYRPNNSSVFETGLPEEDVFKHVGKIMHEYPELEIYSDILRKGAILANDNNKITEKNAHYFEDFEKIQVEKERLHPIRSQSLAMYLIAITASFAAVNFGMDESAVGGAQLQYAQEFNLTNANLKGTINAAPYLAAGVLGAPIVVYLDKYFGRKVIVFVSCIIGVVGSLWQSFSPNWQCLLIARLFLGLGMGLNSATVPMLIAESSPAASRGAFLMLWQTFVAFGFMLGSVFNRAFVNIEGYTSWRLMIGSSTVPPLIAAIFILLVPESPRWFISVGKHEEALKSLFKLRATKVAGARDFYILYESLRKVNELNKIPISKQVALFFGDRRIRFALVVSSFVIFMQQYCGVNILVGYTTTILVEAGIDDKTAIAGSIGIGGGCFLATFISSQLIDRHGRRIMLLATFPVLGAALFWLGGSLYIESSTSRLGSGLTAMYVFVLAFGLGIGPVSWTINAEAYPLHVRALGVAIGMSWNWILDFVLSMTWPKMADSMTTSGGLFFYGAWNLAAFVFTYFFVPETKQLTLEELDEVFAQGSHKFFKDRAKTLFS
ncbi:hypothetical protein NADFUDRAFT_53656 [Nadsonia fulvescens var. elongata DSM 6958]|uniref:Major facilitator superfamily (MFS) profile domain-containing protein n=1 Tax=Nadsonia fulvescens var. elongata DSM 6958 TaxID=857566 RepID=A0A1E3PD71_9ASCO|nr:hypothetical protein NADFUDRAFT_53656 [Nadsonia fulvescens var. elongata DSM 6958]